MFDLLSGLVGLAAGASVGFVGGGLVASAKTSVEDLVEHVEHVEPQALRGPAGRPCLAAVIGGSATPQTCLNS